MSIEYIEVNSAYRNRNQYPLASSFVVPISESGDKNASTAVDPVSNAYPQIVFTPFSASPFTGILAPNTSALSNTSENTVVIVSIPIGQNASKVDDYYAGIIMRFANGANIEYRRILEWTYLNTSGGQNFFEVMLLSSISSAQQPNISTISMSDPSSLADTARPILYIPNSISTENYYINEIIFNQTRGEWLPISHYDGRITHLAELDTQNAVKYTAGTWQLTDRYVVRTDPPVQYGNNLTGLTAFSAVLVPLGPSAPRSAYVGSFIRVLNTGVIVRIVDYNTTTNVASVASSFGGIPSGAYELLQFTRDNQGYLQFNSSFASIREAVCYDISLINLVLPNFTLAVGQGSRPIFYPYIYVELQSEKNSDRQGSNSIISNNPNATRMLFRALINDNVDSRISPFIRLDGNGMVHRIKLDPLSSYRFSVHLPDGSLFETILPEYFSPSAPNSIAQISAMFSFQRVET